MEQNATLDAIVTIAIAAIPIILTPLALLLRQYIQVKIASLQNAELRTWISKLVLAAEQQFAGIGNDEAKLNYVTEHAYAFAIQLGLPLTRAQIRALIEAAVMVETTPVPPKTTTTMEGGGTVTVEQDQG